MNRYFLRFAILSIFASLLVVANGQEGEAYLDDYFGDEFYYEDEEYYEPEDFYCLDESGNIIEPGASYQPDNCHNCKCPSYGGKPVCSHVDCPDTPKRGVCVIPPGECCEVCVKNGCITPDGQQLSLGEILTLGDGQCCSCLEDRTVAECRIPLCPKPPIPEGCQLKINPVTCCEECTVCVDRNGDIHQPGETFNLSPCEFCSCPENPAFGFPICAEVDCPDPPLCPDDFITLETECCPVCPPDDGCIAPDGTRLKVGEVVTLDDGSCCSCLEAGTVAQCRIPVCIAIALPEKCRAKVNPETCCPECTKCVDRNGDVRKPGESFDLSPCETCFCPDNPVSGDPVCAFIDCAAPPCKDFFVPEGKCCPVCPEPKVCIEGDGTIRQDGEVFPAGDGCNTCTCSAPLIACTLIACVDKPGKCPVPIGAGICVEKCFADFECPDAQKCCSNGCGHVCQDPVKPKKVCKEADGTVRQDGETFPAGDGCNTCTCIAPTIACTEIACAVCVEKDGTVRQDGETFPAGDGCNTCTCTAPNIACTEIACPTDEPKPEGCTLPNGKVIAVGEKKRKSCVVCKCLGDGQEPQCRIRRKCRRKKPRVQKEGSNSSSGDGKRSRSNSDSGDGKRDRSDSESGDGKRNRSDSESGDGKRNRSDSESGDGKRSKYYKYKYSSSHSYGKSSSEDGGRSRSNSR